MSSKIHGEKVIAMRANKSKYFNNDWTNRSEAMKKRTWHQFERVTEAEGMDGDSDAQLNALYMTVTQ